MVCPACQASTRVLESRPAPDGGAVRRRRECSGCGRRFTTFERRESDPMQVIKRDGERQPFDRAKLRAGMLRAAHKRPVDPADVEQIVDRIEVAVEAAGGELAARPIGEMCLDGLRQLDRVSYLQFASVYKEFADVDDVQAELAELDAEPLAGSVRAAREDAEFPPNAA
jgi:transcriptional repressor NrdR